MISDGLSSRITDLDIFLGRTGTFSGGPCAKDLQQEEPYIPGCRRVYFERRKGATRTVQRNVKVYRGISIA